MLNKLFIFKVETNGDNPKKNGIHQLSAIIVTPKAGEGECNFKMKPFPFDRIEMSALEISNTTVETLNSYPEPLESYNKIKTTLEAYINKYDKNDKFHLVGYNNSSFDDKFFKAFFEKNGDPCFGAYFFTNSIDVMNISSMVLLKRRYGMETFELKTVAKEFGIETDESKLNDSNYDLQITYKIFNELLKYVKIL